MNERFLFRAYWKKEKRWINDFFLENGGERISVRELKDGKKQQSFALFRDIDVEIVQSTGLHDRNGKLIFEGDILKRKQYIGGNFAELNYEFYQVAWDKQHAGFQYQFVHNPTTGRHPFGEDEIEIIGNIFENPELLTEKL